MDITSVLVNAGLACALFSSMYIVYARNSLNRNVFAPDSPMPAVVTRTFPNDRKAYPSPFVPWSTKVRRTAIACKSNACNSGSPGYNLMLSNSSDTMYLSTQRDFVTEWPTVYPVATIVTVPNGSPIKFLIDVQGNQTGLRPLVVQGVVNSLLDMTGSSSGSQGIGLNITGDWAHSFVVYNDSSHEVYFKISEATASGYWSLKPKSWTLMWPSSRFYVEPTVHAWNASALPPMLQSNELAAQVAEIVMDDLAKAAPSPAQ